LRGLDNVVLMPHFGGVGSSKKSELESSRRLGQNISKAIFGGTLDNIVNASELYSK
jgi:phosphoglycerate dehydrogenase-like enzyme